MSPLSTAADVVRTAAEFRELSPVGALRCYLAGVEVRYRDGHIIGQDCFMWDVFSGDREYKIAEPAVKFGKITLKDQIRSDPKRGDVIYIADSASRVRRARKYEPALHRELLVAGVLHWTAEGAEEHWNEITRLSTASQSD